jgi:ribosomal protein L37E
MDHIQMEYGAGGKMNRMRCEYCGRKVSDEELEACVGCGAPLPEIEEDDFWKPETIRIVDDGGNLIRYEKLYPGVASTHMEKGTYYATHYDSGVRISAE